MWLVQTFDGDDWLTVDECLHRWEADEAARSLRAMGERVRIVRG